MSHEPFIAHSDLTQEIYIIQGKSKYCVTDQVVSAMKATGRLTEPKKGHWIWQTEDIYKCSECGEDIHVKEVMNIPQYVCCPMCKAEMGE